MRFLHVADTHLGFRQFAGCLDPERQINQREADVYRAWHAAIDHAITREVDAVIHAGDLFDSPRPTPRAITEALDGFARLHDAGIPVIVIAGNHSTPRTRSGGSVFEILERYPGIHAIWRAPERINLGGVAFHAIPHEPDGEKLRETIRGLELVGGGNVLVAHGDLDIATTTAYGEGGAVELETETLATIEVDYIALGHLHSYQAVQSNAAYCGSLERLDFADTARKVFVEVDLAQVGEAGFITTTPWSAREVFTIDVSCGGLGPTEVVDTVEARVASYALEGAVLRLRLDDLARDVYQALDTQRLDELLDPCLHHQLALGTAGLVAGTEAAEAVDFEAFVRAEVPVGVDAERVVQLAKRFLTEAGAGELGQEDAA